MASKTTIGTSLGALGVLGAAAGLLLGDFPVLSNTFDFETVIAKPPPEVHRCLTTPEGLQLWWARASELTDLPDLTVTRSGEQLTFTAASGEVVETWQLVTDTPEQVAYTVETGRLTISRTFSLSPTDAGTSLVWREAGRKPVFKILPLMGFDASLDEFLTSAKVLGNVSC